MNSFVLSLKPASHNAGCRPKYQNAIRTEIGRKTPVKLYQNKLYARIYYFYREDKKIDADNMSKPILDSLQSLIYDDDEQVKYRIVAKVDLNYANYNLSSTNIDLKVFGELLKAIAINEHTVYIEVGVITNNIPTSFGEPV